MYDFIFGIATYKSASNAIRLLKSTHHLGVKSLFILNSSIKSDIDKIIESITPNNDIEFVLFNSSINNLYLSTGWGFVWAKHIGLEAQYFSNLDDDVEFTPESSQILDRLKLGWKIYDPCLMAFRTNAHGYLDLGYERRDDWYSFNPEWVNGELMFVPWLTVLSCGLVDSLPESSYSCFVVSEYCHRLRYLTKKPVVVDCEKIYYIHHFREPGKITDQRASVGLEGISKGQQLWARKYNIPEPNFQFHGDEHSRLFKLIMNPKHDNQIKRHLLFDGLWTDWDAIYNKISPLFNLIYDGRN